VGAIVEAALERHGLSDGVATRVNPWVAQRACTDPPFFIAHFFTEWRHNFRTYLTRNVNDDDYWG